VRYPQGADVLGRLRWDRPLAVAYGATASVLEVETAYQLTSTLQSATGRPVWLSSVADLPDSLRQDGTVVLLGTPTTNALVAGAPAGLTAAATAGGMAPPGVIAVAPAAGGQGQWLLLTGPTKEAAQAAAIEVVLRYWKNAKDATAPLAGLERGSALGNRAGVTVADPP
jgi:hypothetical protein